MVEYGRVPTAGVAMTAIGVAVIRARESDRPDRLYDDPYARLFVRAAHAQFAGTPDGEDRWAGMLELADAFYEGRTLTVRIVDDGVTAAAAVGCEQFVLLGAGLDTRAFRMPLTARTRFFEIDLRELFAFKESVLDRAGVTPVCERITLSADLRGDWAEPLRAGGFRPEAPTHWVEEGVLGYLSTEAAWAVVDTITRLSAPGSTLQIGQFAVSARQPKYAALGSLVRAGRPAARASGLGAQARGGLERRGWRTEFRPWEELVVPLGRTAPADETGAGLLFAVRR
ncbi:SAM-dependent methyltransferase [Nocardia farcinica]|uniref:SAM-dependent methyltransferase n=1 Tax=Nocardia farcinica TaxID=37329 RepID=UPI002457B289|nr:SAM-dependent methyltransferase [Nocardia farcinica]